MGMCDSCRLLDIVFQVLLVWFYSVATLREHILIANGSRIMAWWLMHHYFAIAFSVVMLTWSVAEPFTMFRTQFMYFSLYLGVVQLLQHKYQQLALYKKRALGQSETMETTSELPSSSLFFWILFFLMGVYVCVITSPWFHLSAHGLCRYSNSTMQ